MNLPILFMGDLNNIMNANEKMGPGPLMLKESLNFVV
jgi:hypothetical protein